MGVAAERVADQDRVVARRRELAVGLVRDPDLVQISPAVERHGIRINWLERRLGAWFHYGTAFRGRSFAKRKRVLPGVLPGVGYDYDRVWDGRPGNAARSAAALVP